MTEPSTTRIPHWLPNAISVVRVLLVPVWGGCAEACRHAHLAGDVEGVARYRFAALAVLVTIGVSDVLDGYLARRYGLASRIGATLDAFADKLAQVGLLLFFCLRGAPAFPSAPPWFFALIIARDVFIATGWIALRRRLGRVEVDHRPHGKLASVLLFVLLVLWTADAAPSLTAVLVWVIAVLVVFSTADYARFGFSQLRG